MNKILFRRALVLLTALFGILVIFSDHDKMSNFNLIVCFGIFAVLSLASYLALRNCSEKDLDKIMGNDIWKKFGLDINDED